MLANEMTFKDQLEQQNREYQQMHEVYEKLIRDNGSAEVQQIFSQLSLTSGVKLMKQNSSEDP